RHTRLQGDWSSDVCSSDLLQGQRDLGTVGRMLLSELAPLVNAQQGVMYQMESEDSGALVMLSAFAGDGRDDHLRSLKLGEGLIRSEERRVGKGRGAGGGGE